MKKANLKTIDKHIKKGLDFLISRQGKDGSWQGDYGGPVFLLPMYVITAYIIDLKIEDRTKHGIINYLKNIQNKDKGFGLHVEGPSFLLSTTLVYVALRILGIKKDEEPAKSSLKWIKLHKGPYQIPLWGRFMLALVNLYEYEGINPLLPELWLLPYSVPFQPGRLWCHSRVIFLTMSHIYGKKAKKPLTPLVEEIRKELYEEPYKHIDFSKWRNSIASTDLYVKHSFPLRFANRLFRTYERFHLKSIRERALSFTLDHIRHEDEATNYIDLGPVNKLLNTIASYFENPESQEFYKARDTMPKYLWEAGDGIKMQGYNSTQLWDTAFATQAIISTTLWKHYLKHLYKAYEYIAITQIKEDVPDYKKYFRHKSKGGWPFSNNSHGWPISDCTSEGLKSALILENHVKDPIPDYMLIEAASLILSLQNKDGGWATYENTRALKFLERFNASEIFGDIMIDYSYVECTSACLQALIRFQERYPRIFRSKIKRAINRGQKFILEKQRKDGSWEGSLGICFTYGTWFGVWGLLASGLNGNHPAVVKACKWLLSNQNKDGGWGEHWTSCSKRRYIPLEESHIVMTSWALMTLIKAGYPAHDAIKRGIELLCISQLQDGDWPSGSMSGIFNKNCTINYDTYRNYFPVWAMGLYRQARLI